MEKKITLTRGITAMPYTVIIPKTDHALSLFVKLDGIDVDVAASFKWSHDGLAANAVDLVDEAGEAVALTVSATTGEGGIMLTDLLAGYVHVTFAITGVTVPTIADEAESAIDQMNATIGANITTNGGETDVFVEYGLTNKYGSIVEAEESPLNDGENAQAITTLLTGLTEGTTYHYRLKAVNAKGTTIGTDQTFATLDALAPTIASEAEDEITQLEADIEAAVTPNGAATTVTLQYGKTNTYGTNVSLGILNAGLTADTVSASLAGLDPNTTYHYRIVAVNTAGTTNGTDQTFATLAVAAPTIASVSEGFINDSEIRLGATITPNGAETTVTVEVGETTDYGMTYKIDGETVPAGTAGVKVLARITGLEAESTYHYRFVAVNSADTTNGTDGTFKTE